ncbi:hypothetical protein BT67DRAFT_496808 [Trichocladium antarcticum]|uniref:Uncharacterized protein n=1 Tax=Trichocladium antarcticum TaxID=1450529 RepID=A0AAN6UJR2_9PEZI|nr:hypothetical protein BT67DRAFT_496808 [Trichocladium antarcticum]
MVLAATGLLLFKRLVSIFTEGNNTLPAGPATNEQQENSATAAAAAAAATAAATLAALPDLEPDPIYKTNIEIDTRKKKKKEDANELSLQIVYISRELRAEPTRAKPKRVKPERAEPKRAEPKRAEPKRAEPELTKG